MIKSVKHPLKVGAIAILATALSVVPASADFASTMGSANMKFLAKVGIAAGTAEVASGGAATPVVVPLALAAIVLFQTVQWGLSTYIYFDSKKSPKEQPIDWLNHHTNNEGWDLYGLTYVDNVLHGKFIFPSTVNHSVYRCSIRMYNGSQEINSVTTGCNNFPQYFNYTVPNVTGISLIYQDVSSPPKGLSVVNIGTAPYINTLVITPVDPNPAAPVAPETITLVWEYEDGTKYVEEVPYTPGVPIEYKNPNPQKTVKGSSVTYKEYGDDNRVIDKRTIYEGDTYVNRVTNAPVTNNTTKYYPTTNTYYNPTTNTYYNATENITYQSNIINQQTQEYVTPEKEVKIIPPSALPMVTADPPIAPQPSSPVVAEGGNCGNILSNPLSVFSCLFVPSATGLKDLIKGFEATVDGSGIGQIKDLTKVIINPITSGWGSGDEGCLGIPVDFDYTIGSGAAINFHEHPFSTCEPGFVKDMANNWALPVQSFLVIVSTFVILSNMVLRSLSLGDSMFVQGSQDNQFIGPRLNSGRTSRKFTWRKTNR